MSEEVQKLYREGCSALDAENYELANLKFTEAISLDPHNKDLRIAKGVAVANQRRFDDALKEFDKVLELFPDCGTAWTQKANVLNNCRLAKEAEMSANNALRLNIKDGEAWGEKGFALEMQSRIDEAMVCYDEQILLSPAGGWARKGSLLTFHYCDYENGISCFDKALDLDDQNSIAWNGKGSAYSCLGLHEVAVKCFDKSLKAFPTNSHVWNNKGIELTFQGKFQEAEKCFETASTLDPSFIAPITSLGYLNLNQGKLQEALKWFDKSLVFDEEKHFTVQGKALCEYLMANPRPPTCPDPNEKYLQKLNKLNQSQLYFFRGKTLVIFGALDQAKKAFERCLEFNPNYKAAAIEIREIDETTQKEEAEW